MGDMSDIARKYRRALRNQTGFNLSYEQALALAEHGALALISNAENDELCPAKLARSLSANTGSTSAATASPPMSGRSRGTRPALEASDIAALASGF